MEILTENSKLQIGQPAPYFNMPSTAGRIYSLADFSAAKALAIIFTSNQCPYARAYEQRLGSIAAYMTKREGTLVAICSNDGIGYPEDSFETMIETSKRLNFSYPYLRDEDQSAAKAYGARCTPEAFLFDQERKLAYHGSIDDNYADADRVENPYLLAAFEQALNGRPCFPALTKVLGCSIKWKQS